MITTQELKQATREGKPIDYNSSVLLGGRYDKSTGTFVFSVDIDSLIVDAYNAGQVNAMQGEMNLSPNVIQKLGGIETAISLFKARGWTDVKIGPKYALENNSKNTIETGTYLVTLSNNSDN